VLAVILTLLSWTAAAQPAHPVGPTTRPADRATTHFAPLVYQAPGAPEAAGVRHLCLIYHGSKKRVDFTADALLPYVAHVDANRRPTDWFFDSFLFLEFVTDTDAWFHHYREGRPQATAADWAWLADCWFRPQRGLAAMDAAIESAGQVLHDPDHKAKIVICMPVPLPQIRDFGPLAGQSAKLDFSREADRRQALEWYIDRVLASWRVEKYKHLELVGFYWTAESIPTTDAAVVRSASDLLHARGQKLFWIPYFGSHGLPEWRSRGIDAAMLQPNYFFPSEVRRSRLTSTARNAVRAGCGIEIEFDQRALGSDSYRQRFWQYLDAGVKFGWMRGALLGYYEGGGALKALAESSGETREMYDALYRFVKGAYVPIGRGGFEPMSLQEWDPERNFALASRGSKATAIDGSSKPAGVSPNLAIDGDSIYYYANERYARFPLSGSLTVQLPAPADIGLVQMLLWDLDDRSYQYRIDTSLDGKTWEPAVDHSTGEHRSWQVEPLRPRKARYVRVSGLSASTGSEMRVVEIELYPPRASGGGTQPSN
jgi:hypothetical protein